MSPAFNLYFYYHPSAGLSLNMLQYRQNVLWMPKKCSCAVNMVKNLLSSNYLTGLQVGQFVDISYKNFKYGYFRMVLFRRIKLFFFTAKYEVKL